MVRKQLCLIFTIYLAVAVVGSFSFSAVEGFHLFESRDNLSSSGGFFTSISPTIDCLAENTAAGGKTGKCSSSSLAFMPYETPNTEIYLSGSLQTIDAYHIPIIKDTIPLKLRI